MKWFWENLGLVVVMVIAAVSFLRGVFRAAKGGGETPARPSQRPFADPEEEERTRRIQAEIRRKIAERRAATGETVALPEPAAEVFEAPRERIPPMMRPTTVPPVDPFGGPMRKIVRKLEEAAQSAEQRWNQSDEAENAVVLERQRELEAQLRALEAARAAEQQRASQLTRHVTPVSAGVPMRGGRLRDDLRDREQLRRAFVLREVLGTPVGLR